MNASKLLNPNSHLNQSSSGSEHDSTNGNDKSTSFDISAEPNTSKRIKPVTKRRVAQNDSDQKYYCSFCPKVLSSRIAKNRHEYTHTGERKYKCSYCPNAYLYPTSVKVHERTHTGEKPFSCSYCSRCFTFQNSKIRHERTHTRDYPFKCTVCTSAFNTQQRLDIHTATHLKTKGKEDIPKKEPKLEASKRNVKSISMKLFKCAYCPKLWRNAYDKKRHERIHTRDAPFKCAYCSKAFSQRVSKSNHERVHLRESVNARNSFSNHDTTLKFEKKKVHVHSNKLRMKSHKCTYCYKGFLNRSSLLRHERIHTGEKPFNCAYCLKTFNARGNMVKHQALHLKNKLSADDVHNRTLKTDTENQSNLPLSMVAASLNIKFEERTESDKDNRISSVRDMKEGKPKKNGPLSKTSKVPRIVTEKKETKLCSLCLRSYQGTLIKDKNNYSPSLCTVCSSAFFHDAHT